MIFEAAARALREHLEKQKAEYCRICDLALERFIEGQAIHGDRWLEKGIDTLQQDKREEDADAMVYDWMQIYKQLINSGKGAAESGGKDASDTSNA